MFKSSTVINLVPIVTGGGLQNGLSFVRNIGRVSDIDVIVACRSGSSIQVECEQANVPCVPVSSRRNFEFWGARRTFGSKRTCLTLFGSPPLCTVRNWVNILGVAYSNLYYPEIRFWHHLGRLARARKQMKDLARRFGVGLADAWIFETEVLAERAKRSGYPKDRVYCVPMGVSSVVEEYLSSSNASRPDRPRKRILYLGSPHPNKRQHLLPAVAEELERIRPGKYEFAVTFGGGEYAKSVLGEFSRRSLDGMVVNIGVVPPGEVASQISDSDAMCLLSELESFSNNFVEAWACRRPIFVTDADWSRSACGSGAIFIDPKDPGKAAAAIVACLESADAVDAQVCAGLDSLSRCPTGLERVRMYMDVVDRIVCEMEGRR